MRPMVIGERLALSALLTGLYLPGIEEFWLGVIRGIRNGWLTHRAVEDRIVRPSAFVESSGFRITEGLGPFSPLSSHFPPPDTSESGGPAAFHEAGLTVGSSQSFQHMTGFATCRELLECLAEPLSAGTVSGCARPLSFNSRAAALLAERCPSMDGAPALLRRHGFAAEAAQLEMPGLMVLALQLVQEGLVLTPLSPALLGRRQTLRQTDAAVDLNSRDGAAGRLLLGRARPSGKKMKDGPCSGTGQSPEGAHQADHPLDCYANWDATHRLAGRGIGSDAVSPFERNVFWAWGPDGALPAPLIGLVGSRLMTPGSRRAAAAGARAVLRSGAGVVTGGAAGVDSAALDEASLSLAPRAVIFHPWGLFSPEGERLRLKYPWAWHLSLACPFGGFESRLAHQRNRLIYSVSVGVIAVGPRFGSGGTWRGALEGLRAKLAPLLLVGGCGELKAESALAALGAGIVTVRDLTAERLVDLLASQRRSTGGARSAASGCRSGTVGDPGESGQAVLFAPDDCDPYLEGRNSVAGRQCSQAGSLGSLACRQHGASRLQNVTEGLQTEANPLEKPLFDEIRGVQEPRAAYLAA